MKRTHEELEQERQFLTNLVNDRFGQEITLAAFAEKVHEIISERVQDYIYQRYRDWDTLELLKLLSHWEAPVMPKPLELPSLPDVMASEGEEPYPTIVDTVKKRRGRRPAV